MRTLRRKKEKRPPNWRRKMEQTGEIPMRGVPFSVVVPVTSVLAACWLGRYNKRNRKFKEQRICQMQSDILAGYWRTLHSQGICFSSTGILLDGQNRLEAVRRAGKTCDMMVTFNEDPSAVEYIDTGVPRSTLDLSNRRDTGLTSLGLSCASATLQWGLGTKQPRNAWSQRRIIDFATSHKDAIDFVCEAMAGKKRRGVHIGPVLGAIMKAYYHVNRAMLHEFCRALATGEYESTQYLPAIRLRDHLSGPGYDQSFGGRRKQMAKTAYAIDSVVKKRKLSRLQEPKRDPHPLPDPGEWIGR